MWANLCETVGWSWWSASYQNGASGSWFVFTDSFAKPVWRAVPYLGDIFDGVKTLDFSKAPETGKVACGHISKDTETVAWAEDLVLDGAVELYLVKLEEHFRLMLREELEVGKNTAEIGRAHV